MRHLLATILPSAWHTMSLTATLGPFGLRRRKLPASGSIEVNKLTGSTQPSEFDERQKKPHRACEWLPRPPFFNRGAPRLEQGDHALRKWGLSIPCTQLAELDGVNESESVRWEGGGVFDVHAEFGTALQEVGQDLSGVSVPQTPGRRHGCRLRCRWRWWWWEEEAERRTWG